MCVRVLQIPQQIWAASGGWAKRGDGESKVEGRTNMRYNRNSRCNGREYLKKVKGENKVEVKKPGMTGGEEERERGRGEGGGGCG